MILVGNQVCRNSLSFLSQLSGCDGTAHCANLLKMPATAHTLCAFTCGMSLRLVLSINYRYLLFPRVMDVRTRSPQAPKGWMSNLYLEPRVHRHRLPHICSPMYSRLLCLHTLIVSCIVHSCNPNRGPLTYLSCTHTPWSCVPPRCWTRVPQDLSTRAPDRGCTASTLCMIICRLLDVGLRNFRLVWKAEHGTK